MALLSKENVSFTGIGEGDAGIILRRDGTFQIFNTHKSIDPNNPTARQIEQGRQLAAFALALSVPKVMDILYAMSEDPQIVGDTVDMGALQ